MENNIITIHQAFYGEVNRSHACINQTFVDPELASFLIAFTDRPAALPPGMNLSPYLSGSIFSNYYIFTKTFSDPTATRAGMVFTHALVLNFNDLIYVNDLNEIFNLFVESVDNKNNKITKVELDYTDTRFNHQKVQPQYIQQIISEYVRGVKPILFSGELKSFRNALQCIWNSPNPASRKKLKFRTSFTPSDVISGIDLTIVLIQNDFLSKWQGQKIISDKSNDLVEVISYAEALFLGYQKENPFYDFLNELNVDITDIHDYTPFEKIFDDLSSIDSIDNENIIRQDIRVLSKISPSSDNGKIVKEKFIKSLLNLIKNKRDTNIKALRNIDWSAFNEGEKIGRQIVSHFVKREFENPDRHHIQLFSELINLSLEEAPQNWWHKSLIDSVISIFKYENESVIKTTWQLIDSSTVTLKNILLIIGNIKGCEEILRRIVPDKMRVETYQTLIPLAKNKNWLMLHADILLKQFSPELALEKQLQVEKRLTLEKSIGVTYLSRMLSSENLITLTLKLCDKKLISISADSVNDDISLLKNIDLAQTCWLEIWTLVVLKTRNIFGGLKGKEEAIIFTILDLLIKGRELDSTILTLISDTSFTDISKYPQRKKVWSLLPSTIRNKFLKSTKYKVLDDLLADKIKPQSIEPELIEEFISDSFMTAFLNENRFDIEPIIIIYSSFLNLRDNFLADYISYYRYAITEEQAKKLGSLVLRNNLSKSARSIYDKSQYDYSFRLAYEICKEIVNINWLESLLGSVFARRDRYESTTSSSFSPNLQNMLIKDLPTVVILTAIKEEYLAVKSHLSDIVEADRNDTMYEAGIFEFNNEKIAKVFIRECGAKNTIAAQESEKAIQYFNPDLMLFVGIAGSRKSNDFVIGDVIFPEKVYSYEGGKSEKDSFQARPDFALMSYPLMEIAKRIRLKNDWKRLIKGNWEEEVNANLGIIASGELLVEHYESDIGRILTKHYNDTSAVEMEGFGFAKAANRQGRQTNNILIGVVRGISDVIEQPSKKKRANNKDRRPDYAKKIASDTAAAFAFWLIFKVFEKK